RAPAPGRRARRLPTCVGHRVAAGRLAAAAPNPAAAGGGGAQPLPGSDRRPGRRRGAHAGVGRGTSSAPTGRLGIGMAARLPLGPPAGDRPMTRRKRHGPTGPSATVVVVTASALLLLAACSSTAASTASTATRPATTARLEILAPRQGQVVGPQPTLRLKLSG